MQPIFLTAVLASAWLFSSSSIVFAGAIGQKGTDPYVTHFIFRPLQTLDVSGVGTATLLEAVGTTENMKGETMFNKMSARCTALSIDSGGKKYMMALAYSMTKMAIKFSQLSIRAMSTNRSRI